MGIIFFFKNRKTIIDGKKLEFIRLINDWGDFLARETYLTYIEKDLFISKIKHYGIIPWHCWLNISIYVNQNKIRKNLEELDNKLRIYNEQFIDRRLEDYSSFFQGKDDNLSYPLDIEQRKAIIKDDNHNLVIAGAGSGKTSVLTSRIAYLIRRKDNIDPSRILALAFTNTAAKEMQERIKINFNHNVEIMTFHKLGMQILKEESKKNQKVIFGGGNKTQEEKIFFTNLLNRFLKKKQNQKLYFKYLPYHNEQELTKSSFNTKEEYYKYMNTKRYMSLNNVAVKSFSEREIANFLFIHNIKFEYEQIADWADSDKDKEYHPDFFLPEFDIFIEHWGLDRNNKVPKWFSIGSEEYNDIRDWKLAQYKKHNKILIETWDFERWETTLIHNLKDNLVLENKKINFKRLSYKELVEKTYEFKEKRREVIDSVIKFIGIAKSNMLEIKDISKKIMSNNYSKVQTLFADIALEVYKLYESELIKNNKIDFNDMINKAVEIIKMNHKHYRNKYDHILIDEYQDISYQRMELIKGFVNRKSKTKLFCVGDDWQSIYQFTGSNVEYIVEMDKYFPNPEITILKTNYRSTKAIVDISNNLIKNNSKQVHKIILSTKLDGQRPFICMISDKYSFAENRQISHIFNKIKDLLDTGIDPNEIMIISRFWKILMVIKQNFSVQGLPVNLKNQSIRFNTAHSSKGTEAEYVFLVDITSGKFGFPCEIDESSILEIAKRIRLDNQLEEERRLFYVALTRSKRHLYIYTSEKNQSRFIKEIERFVQKGNPIDYVEFKKKSDTQKS